MRPLAGTGATPEGGRRPPLDEAGAQAAAGPHDARRIDLYVAESEDLGWYAGELVNLMALDDNQGQGAQTEAPEARSASPIGRLLERMGLR